MALRATSITQPARSRRCSRSQGRSLTPFRDANNTLKINAVQLLARCTDAGTYSAVLTPPLPAPPPSGSNTFTLAANNLYGGLHFNAKPVEINDVEVAPTTPAAAWRLKVTRPGGGNLKIDPTTQESELQDAYLVLQYHWV